MEWERASRHGWTMRHRGMWTDFKFGDIYAFAVEDPDGCGAGQKDRMRGWEEGRQSMQKDMRRLLGLDW